MTVFRWGDATDIGQVRENNQDLALVGDDYFAVADGMGGHSGGETAARIAIDTLSERFSESTLDALVQTVEVANERVVSQAEADPDLRGMGTTLCVLAAVTHEDTEVIGVVNVGDSRAYLVDGDELVQLTKDHTLVQMLVDQGQLSEEEAEFHPQRNILTRALGIDARVMVDSYLLRPVAGDRYLICSDGLYGEVDDGAMLTILADEADPEAAAELLVDAANEAGGHDNVTCIVIDVVEGVDGDAAAAAGTADEDEEPEGTDRVIGSETGQHRLLAAAAEATSEGGDASAVDDATGEEADTSRDAGESLGPAASRRRRFTWRTGLFVGVFLIVVALAVGAVAFFARSTYYVGEQGGEVVIFRGRPGGVLWFAPTVEDSTGLAVDDLPRAFRQEVEDGKDQPTLGDADRYVDNLREEIERLESEATERRPSSPSGDGSDDEDVGGETPPTTAGSQPEST